MAMLTNLLCAFGNIIGSNAYTPIGPVKQHANLFVLVVGETGRGARKTQARAEVMPLFKGIDREWYDTHILSSLSTGEGVAERVRDGDDDESDPGEHDKRLLVSCSEFVNVLNVKARTNRILTGILRQAWDGQSLMVPTRNDPIVATEPHISITADTMPDELKAKLTSVDMANGFGNRFLLVRVKRSQKIHLPEPIADYGDIPARLRSAVAKARRHTAPMLLDDAARRLYGQFHDSLPDEPKGMIGERCSRAETHVLRLALIYALQNEAVYRFATGSVSGRNRLRAQQRQRAGLQ
jgi:hypothetical protein